MKKGNLVRELEKKQERMVNLWEMKGDKPMEDAFLVDHIAYVVDVTENKYLKLLHDQDIKIHFQYLKSIWGVGLTLDAIRNELSVSFGKNGFYCCRQFYGILLEEVRLKLGIYAPYLSLDSSEKIKKLDCWEKKRVDIDKEIEKDLVSFDE